MTIWNLSTTEPNSVKKSTVFVSNDKEFLLEETYNSAVYAIVMKPGMTVEPPEGLIGPEEFTGELHYTMPNTNGIDISNYLGENVSSVNLVSMIDLKTHTFIFSNNISENERQTINNIYNTVGVSGFSDIGYTQTKQEVDLFGMLDLDCVEISN